jgi:hypothetical protein
MYHAWDESRIEYYLKENVVTNDYKGVGPFIMASLEMEALTDK